MSCTPFQVRVSIGKMGGKRNETMMNRMRKNGNHSSTSQSRKGRTSFLSGKKQQNSNQSFWSRHRRSSDTSSDDGSDSLSPYNPDRQQNQQQKQQWWEVVDFADEASAETSIGSYNNTSVDEGPSDEEARPSNLFRRDATSTGSRRHPGHLYMSQAHKQALSVRRVVALPNYRSSSSNYKKDLYFLPVEPKSTTHRSSPTPSYEGNATGSVVGAAPYKSTGRGREQRRTALIAHYLYGEAASQARTSNLPNQFHARGPEDDFDNYDDDGIVDHARYMDDSEADGVARRRSCFPSFARTKFFGNKGGGSQDTSNGPQEEEEEAYDYDYYFTIGDSNNVSNKNNNDIEKQPTQAGTWRGTENNMTCHRMMQCTDHHPSPQLLRRSYSHSSHSTDASPLAVGPAVCSFDHPDVYCFFPVDDHSNDDDAYDEYDDNEHRHHKNSDLPFCNWNDIRFYSAACVDQLASLELKTHELQAHCQGNSEHFHQQYLEMTFSTSKECVEISPRDALEDLVPQELLSLLLDSCYVDDPSTKYTNSTLGGKKRNKGQGQPQDTTNAMTGDEFQYCR